ncbi:activator-dependent family glycosyltransferase [Nonomuraea sp. SYSU D8015]|uniref:activator-dependent family glycosyltransferase n=1 Tax=Nonomuraea sp. SYSU D8015 TaxID=2593644 RepID=UPI001660854E|nr:activator-dependent family glycosyltransferase [Nonomuraea sp. SYSU D8015]
MRVLITTQAEKTHFLGMVPLGWALRTAGHEVRVASQPDLAEGIADSGLTAVPVGRDHLFHYLLKSVKSLGLDDGSGFEPNLDQDVPWQEISDSYQRLVPWWWKVVNEPMMADLVTFCRQWRPDLVIWEPTTFAGPVAARVCGAAHARLLWGLDLFARMRELFLAGRPADEHEDVLAGWLGGHLAEYGGAFSEDLTRGQFTIDYMPPSLRLDVDVRQVPIRYVPYNGRAVVPDWLRGRPARPRVLLTLGSAAPERVAGHLLSVQELLTVLGDMDIEVVATLSAKQQAELQRVPDNARLVEFVPMHAVLPTCSAVVHHGGAGTYTTALFYGVPQLLLPDLILPQYMFDEPLLAQRLAEQGAGLRIPSEELSGWRVREELDRLLHDPAFHRAAGRVREEMLAMPSPNQVVPELERLVAELREPS